MPGLTEYRITLLDGACTESALSGAPGGIRYGSLKTAIVDMGAEIKDMLPDVAAGRDGAFIYVPEGVKAAGVFVVENRFTGKAEVATESLFLLMNGADAAVRCEVKCDAVCVPSDSRHVRLGERASLRLEDLVLGGGKVSVDNYSLLGEGAVMDTVTVESGCTEALLKYTTDLAGHNAQTTQAGLFVIGGEERTDFDVTVHHLVPGCRSDVLVKGVAGGNAHGSFSGLVHVAQDAQRTEAYQQSRNLLLDDTAQIVTAPQLEIYADDVKCSHGATVGQMNDDAIYYMRQRGLSEAQARGLQMTGFVNDIVSRIGSEEKREEVFGSLNLWC